MSKNLNYQILTVVGISLLPILMLYTQTGLLGGTFRATGNIIGLIAAILMWWQVVLGDRFILAQFIPDYFSILSLHKQIGKYGLLLAFLHPFWQIYNYSESLNFLYKISFSDHFQTYVTLGRIAFFIFIIIWVTSALLRSKLNFRPWLYIHYLVYPMLALIFLHSIQNGTFLIHYPLLKAYWLFFMISFFLVSTHRFLIYFNLNRHTYKLINKSQATPNITFYTFAPTNQKITPKVGQYIYLRSSASSEAHPFTVMQFNHQNSRITLGIKTEGNFTKKLKKIEVGSQVYLDGPYGVFTRQAHNSDPKVIIAGGIGITPFIDLINKYSNNNTFLFYSNRTISEAVLRDKLKSILNNNYLDIISRQNTNEHLVVNGRLSAQIISKHLKPDLLKSANFFVCGSSGFMKSIISDLINLGVDRQIIFSEEFSF
jgi:predicted ferric reductase